MNGFTGDDAARGLEIGDVLVLANHGTVEIIFGLGLPDGEVAAARLCMVPEGAFTFAQTVLQTAGDAFMQKERMDDEATQEAERILKALGPMMKVGVKVG